MADIYPIGIYYIKIIIFTPYRVYFSFNPTANDGTMAKFTIYRTSNGLYTFSLKANNGQVLLSSEGYSIKLGCLNGIEMVRHNGRANNRYERKISLKGKYYFNLKASNGQIIGSSEMYDEAKARDKAITAVKSMVADAIVDDETAQELINLVKEKRKQQGLTQQELSEKAGVGLRFLRELEQGKSTLRIDKVNQVLKLFGYEMGPVLINRNNLLDAES
jgi:uncharacterized protein